MLSVELDTSVSVSRGASDTNLRASLRAIDMSSPLYITLEAICKCAFSRVMIHAHSASGRLRGVSPPSRTAAAAAAASVAPAAHRQRR